MGRIRSIKPEFFTDEELSALSESTHLLAAGLLCYADDEGYFNANIGLIKAAVFPLREPSHTIHGMLSDLSMIGFIELGETQDGKRWGRVVKFNTHQRVNRPNHSKIKCLPIVWEPSLSAHTQLTDDSLNTHTQLTDDSLPEGKGKGTGKGNREGERNVPDAHTPQTAPDPAPAKPDPTPEPPYDFNTDPADAIPNGLSLVQYAIFVLSEVGIPASYTLKVKTGDAIEILAKDEACDLPAATRRMLDRMRKAAEGGPVKWNFWLEDGGWKQEHGNGTNQSSAAKQRIDGNLKALREAAQRRGISGTPDAGGADGETLCDAGCERVNRGLLTGLRATMPEIFAPAIPVGAGGIADQPRAEVLPPAGRSGG
jgi:hypothetical protein